MRLTSSSLLVLLLIGLGLAAGVASAQQQARTFRVTSGSRIQWVSDAPLERITGASDSVSGELSLDPASLAGARGRVTVDVASMRTGLDLRDQHLRGADWLDAGRFPQAIFEITGVEGATQLAPDQTVRVTLRGRFTLHGVTRDVTSSAQVRYVPSNDELRGQGVTGDLIRGQASFDVQLSDYQVSISEIVRLKVSNTIRVNVTLRAVSG